MRASILIFSFNCFALIAGVSVAATMEDTFKDGESFGKNQNSSTSTKINDDNASTSVPKYSTSAPESTYYGRSELTTDGNAKRTACSTSSGNGYDDQSCNAVNYSQTNPSTRPQITIAPNDTVVQKSKAIANNPEAIAGSIDGTFSECTTATASTPDVYENKTCNEAPTISGGTCGKMLNVSVAVENTCVPGTWISLEQYRNSPGADLMYAQVRCDIGRTDGMLTFRFHAVGGDGTCTGWQTRDLPIAAASANVSVAPLAPHWEGSCRYGMEVVEMAGSGCTGEACGYQFLYGYAAYSCPAGQTRGDLATYYDSNSSALLPVGTPQQCYSLPKPDVVTGTCPTGSSGPYDAGAGKLYCAKLEGLGTPGPGGWSYLVPFAFEYPQAKTTSSDSWINECASYEDKVSNGTCQFISSVCVDGPSTKVISGLPITRDCWKEDLAFKCADSTGASDCHPLVDAGCEQINSKCIDYGPDGACSLFEQTYRCKIASGTTSTITNCGTQSYCLSGTCVNSSHPPDKDFAIAVTMLEVAKEAGDTFDPDTFRVFKGTDNRCQKSLFSSINCCETGDAINESPLKNFCSNDEKLLAKKRDEGQCHLVGSYCSQKKLFTCVKKTETYCCFSSLLSRLIHEQGRPQLGKGWGDANNPDCSGLTVTQLQSLDFASMDLSEFYAQIKPTMPDSAKMQSAAGGKVSNCYYGNGACK
ncbi:MAG: conjugal transfer protein TraN [Pseudomonadota bacterium]